MDAADPETAGRGGVLGRRRRLRCEGGRGGVWSQRNLVKDVVALKPAANAKVHIVARSVAPRDRRRHDAGQGVMTPASKLRFGAEIGRAHV